MILNALYDYYQRKPDLPREGWMTKDIDFISVVDTEGRCQTLTPTMQKVGKQWVSKTYLVPAIGPQAQKHSMAGDDPNLLWDNASFVLGLDDNNAKGKKKARHFRYLLKTWFQDKPVDPAILGIRRFLTRLARHPGHRDELLARTLRESPESMRPRIEKLLNGGGTITFRFTADMDSLVCHRPNINSQISLQARPDEHAGVCLITGQTDTIARLNNSIEGVHDKPGTPARKYLVAFQRNQGFDSYGKEQGANAPIGKRAAFAYTTALNHLLGSSQFLQLGDASTVFWAAESHPMEALLSQFFDEPPPSDPDQGTNAVKALFNAPLAGTPAIDDKDTTLFHVLGIAPNSARISVRFWHVATVGELAQHIRRHFLDLKIERPKYVDRPFLSLKTLFTALAQPTRDRPHGDIDKLPPNLAGDFMKAILAGTAYPQTLLQAALRRIHAEQAKKDDKGKHREHVTYARAALIKAWLNSQSRNTNQKGEINVSLDESNTNIGYRLGRLFAVLEKVQEDANPGINTTIRDSYFGSASCTPSAVFPTLVRRNQHHMSKLRKEKPGLYVTRDKLIQSICNDGIDGQLGFQPFLTLADQGRFVIGYYQQRQDFFK